MKKTISSIEMASECSPSTICQATSMTTYSNDLEETLINILSEHTVCIAREINDRAYYEHGVPFESFMALRQTRDGLIEWGTITEVIRDSPYGNPCKFFYLTNAGGVGRMIQTKQHMLFEYSRHTNDIGHFGEQLVAEAAQRLGFTDIKVRERLGKKDVDVLCVDRSRSFYWAIECKNRRQQITAGDIEKASTKAEQASSRWDIEPVKPAMVSSSIYNRIPENPTLPVIVTGSVFVPNVDFFYDYKKSLGSWYLKSINSVPDDLVRLIEEGLRE